MGHIFISYSHKDKKYVHKLRAALQAEGFEVWVDDRIDYGTEWPKVIQRRLDECDALVLVVSDNSYDSKWVQNEAARATRKKKPIFPLLLQGEPWLSVEATNYVDVTDGSLPNEKFYQGMSLVSPRKKSPKQIAEEPKQIPPARRQVGVSSLSTKSKPSNKTGKPNLRYFGIGAIAVIFAIFGITSLVNNQDETPLQTEQPVVEVFPTHTEIIPTNTFVTPTITLTPFQPINVPIITPTPELGIGSTIVSEIDGMVMVYVSEGEFTMGSDADSAFSECQKFKPDCQRDWYVASAPLHTVHLDAYWMDQTEVTNEMYAKCVDAHVCISPSQTKSHTRYSYYGNPEFGNYPVIYVDWFMAKNYCEWAGRRLPTEAEWEKAAHSTNASIYPWGNEAPKKNLLNYKWTEVGDTTEVGSYPNGVSPYGMLDMAGNVSEWVSSLYLAYPYSRNDGREDESASGSRVLRGGGWNHIEPFVFSFGRSGNNPTESGNTSGFRCASDP